MRAYAGAVFRLDKHLRRLEESCRGLGRALPEGRAALGRWVKASLAESGHRDAIARLSVHWDKTIGELVLFVKPFGSHPEAWYRDGVSVRTGVPRRASPKAQEAQVKASQFMAGVYAELDRGGRPAHETLFLNHLGTLAEGSTSNFFLVKENQLLTPPAASGILRGVTRGVVIEIAREEGISVVETALTRHDLYVADECFMTNTSSEVLPVVEADGRRIGSGKPGPVTRALAGAFKRKVSSE